MGLKIGQASPALAKGKHIPRKNPLRTARVAAGLTVDQLAQKAGVDRKTIVRAEARGDWPRQRPQAESVRRALGLDPATGKPVTP